jgi:hypothetical protein
MAGNFHPLVGDQAINARQEMDYVSDTKHYYGFAAPGKLTSDPGWQIRELTLDTNGRSVRVKFANGSLGYDFVWDDRATFDYS